MEAVITLQEMGYHFFVVGEKISFKFCGGVEPAREQVVPLLQQIKANKASVIAFLTIAGTKPHQEPNGRWKQVISYRDVDTDAPKRTTIRGATESEVKAKVRDFNRTISAGVKPNQKKVTFYDWLLTWLEVNKRNTVSEGSFTNYETIVKIRINGTPLAKMQLDKIKRADIQKFFNDMAQTYSPKSMEITKVIINDALKVAEIDSLILKNPCKGIKLPRPAKEQIQPFNPEEITLLLEAAGAGSFMYTVIMFGLRTGARVGEIAGLKWEDIDFKARKIHIRQQAKYNHRGDTKKTLGALKTGTSARTIPLDTKLAECLRWHERRQEKLKLDFGNGYNPLQLVFPDEIGEILNPTTLGGRFIRLIEKLDIPRRTIHDLRHTFASAAICQGLSIKAVSTILGHSKPSITLDIYSHLMPGDEESIIAAIGGYYDKKVDTVIDTVREGKPESQKEYNKQTRAESQAK